MTSKKTGVVALFILSHFAAFGVTPTIRTTTVQRAPGATLSQPNKMSIGSLGGKTVLGRPMGSTNIIHTNIPATQDKISLQSVYEEMNLIRDTIEERLHEHRQTIEDLKTELAEKDDKIAELETILGEYEQVKQSVKDMPATINEEIERRGFATAERMTAEIQAATKNIKSEIASERTAVLTQYAKSADVAANINNARIAAVSEAKQHVANANFATKTDLNNLEVGVNEEAVADIIATKLAENKVINENSLPTIKAFADIKQTVDSIPTIYATNDSVTQGLATTKNSTLTEVQQMGFAKNDTVTAVINEEKTAREEAMASLDNRFTNLGTELTSQGFITDTTLNGKGFITDATLADKGFVTNTVLNNRFAGLGTELTSQGFITDTTLNGKGFITDATLADKGFVTNTVLNNRFSELGTELEDRFADVGDTLLENENFKGGLVTKFKGEFVPFEDLPGTITGLKDTDGNSIFVTNVDLGKKGFITNTELGKKGFITDATLADKGFVTDTVLNNRFTELNTTLDNRFAGLDTELAGKGFITNTELGKKGFITDTTLTNKFNELDGKITVVDNKFADIGDTIAGELLENNEFKGGILAGLGDDIKTLPGTVTSLKDRLDGVDTTIGNFNDRFTGITNKFNDYVLDEDLGTKIDNHTKDKFVLPTTLAGHLTELDNRFIGLDDRFVKEDGFNTRISNFKFAKTTDVDTALNNRFSELNTTLDNRFAGLDTELAGKGFITNTELGKKGFITDTTLTNKFNELDGKITVVDNKFADIGDTIAGELLENNEFKGGILAGLGDDIKSLPTIVEGLRGDITTINNKFGGYDNKITGFDNKFSGIDVTIGNINNTLTNYSGKFGGYDSKITGFDNKFAELDETVDGLGDEITNIGGTITGLDGKFVKIDGLDGTLTGRGFITSTTLDDRFAGIKTDMDTELSKYVPIDGLSTRIGNLKTTDGQPIFVKPGTLTGYALTSDVETAIAAEATARGTAITKAIADAKTETLTAVEGLKFAKLDDLGDYAKTTYVDGKVSAEATARGTAITKAIAAETEARENAISGLSDTYATKAALNSHKNVAITTANLESKLLGQSLNDTGKTVLAQALATPLGQNGETSLGTALGTEIANNVYQGMNSLDYALSNRSTVKATLASNISSNATKINNNSELLTTVSEKATTNETTIGEHASSLTNIVGTLESHATTINANINNISTLNASLIQTNTAVNNLEDSSSGNTGGSTGSSGGGSVRLPVNDIITLNPTLRNDFDWTIKNP